MSLLEADIYFDGGVKVFESSEGIDEGGFMVVLFIFL